MRSLCSLVVVAGLVKSDSVRRLMIEGTIDHTLTDPYSVALLYCYDRPQASSPYICGLFCTGSLIAPNVVVTAAHCLRNTSMPFNNTALDISYTNTYILAGSTDYDSGDWGSQSKIVPVVRAVYEGYGDNIRFPTDGDIALLELGECVTLVPGVIQTIPIGTTATEPTGGLCETITAAGFGQVSNAPRPINDADGKRRHITDVLHSFESCRDAYIAASMGWSSLKDSYVPDQVKEAVIPETFLCSGGNTLDSACYGDSGGPVVAALTGSSKSTVQIVGTTSLGFGDICTLSPDYSTRTSFYAPWIRRHMESTFSTCPGSKIADSFASWPVPDWKPSDLSAEYNATRCGIDGSKWQCSSGKCIGLTQVCDGHVDCPDTSDEDAVYCSYVNAGHARRLTSMHLVASDGTTDKNIPLPLTGLDYELLALIEDNRDVLAEAFAATSGESVKLSSSSADDNHAAAMRTASASKTEGALIVLGVMKGKYKAARPKTDKRFWTGTVLSSETVTCSAAGEAVASGISAVQKEQSTINDRWDATTLNTACNNLLACSGGFPDSGKITFCNELLEYLAANATLADYANNFGSRFNATCATSSVKQNPVSDPKSANGPGAIGWMVVVLVGILVM